VTEPLIRIGAGAAWWGDRIEPAALNAEHGDLDHLCFETMAEATVSAAPVHIRRDPEFPRYDTYLDDRFRAVLPGRMRRGTRIIIKQGWIAPRAAQARVIELLREGGWHGVRVAAIDGRLVADRIGSFGARLLEDGQPEAQLTAERFLAFHRGAIRGEVQRHAVPRLLALNLVCHEAPGGGVSRSLSLDNCGKALSAAVLGFVLEVPEHLRVELRGWPHPGGKGFG